MVIILRYHNGYYITIPYWYCLVLYITTKSDPVNHHDSDEMAIADYWKWFSMFMSLLSFYPICHVLKMINQRIY